jgi:glycosyltransferase involved in cell wall biosynthesis
MRLIENAMPHSPRPHAPLPPGPLRFVVASRWNTWKGHRTLLEAWARLQPTQAELDVLGGPPPIGDAVDVPALIAALPDSSGVVLRGQVDDITEVIDAAHFVVVPSDEPEPFGLVAIEALSRGRGVIASAAGGLADIVHDGVTGALFPPRDAQRLTDILNSLDLEQARDYGAAALSDFDRRYSADRFRNQFRAMWTLLHLTGERPIPDQGLAQPPGSRDPQLVPKRWHSDD